MSERRKQHYVPEFYLRNFTDQTRAGRQYGEEPFVWVYEKGTGECKRRSPKKVAVKSEYYTIAAETPERDEGVEDIFSKLETLSAPVIRSVIDNPQHVLSNGDRSILVEFLASMLVRVPMFRQGVDETHEFMIKKLARLLASNEQRFGSMLSDFKKTTGKGITVPAEELRQFMFDSKKWIVSIRPEVSLGVMLSMFERAVSIISEMRFTLLRVPQGNHLVTSDAPVVLVDPTPPRGFGGGVGLAQPGVEVTLPLGPTVGLLCTWRDNPAVYSASGRAVNQLNKRTALFSGRYIFSAHESRTIAKLARDMPVRSSVMTID